MYLDFYLSLSVYILLDFAFRFILLEYKLLDMPTTANLEMRDTVFIVTQKILRMNINLYVNVLDTLKLDANILIKTFKSVYKYLELLKCTDKTHLIRLTLFIKHVLKNRNQHVYVEI